MSLLVVNAAQVVTPRGRKAQSGSRQGEVGRHPHAVVRAEGPTVVFVGERAEHDRRFGPASEVVDAGGGCVIPAFVDPQVLN